MGYERHHAIIVTSWSEDAINLVHSKAKEIFFKEQITEIIGSVSNGFRTFFIGPDGSKEGWPDSDQGDNAREIFKKWIEENHPWVDAVEVQYVDDDNKLWVKKIHKDIRNSK